MPLLRHWLHAVLAVALVLGAAIAQAQNPSGDIVLLKVVTAKDDVVVGLPKAQVDAMGTGDAVERVAKALSSAGQLAVWQYAPRRDAQGPRLVAVARVVVFAAGVLRLEPYASEFPVVAPAAR